jgi:hypothetical protein
MIQVGRQGCGRARYTRDLRLRPRRSAAGCQWSCSPWASDRVSLAVSTGGRSKRAGSDAGSSQCPAPRVLPRAAFPAAHRQATSPTQPIGHARRCGCTGSGESWRNRTAAAVRVRLGRHVGRLGLAARSADPARSPWPSPSPSVMSSPWRSPMPTANPVRCGCLKAAVGRQARRCCE